MDACGDLLPDVTTTRTHASLQEIPEAQWDALHDGRNPFVSHAFEHGTFFTRLQHFVIASDAFIVVPGGIGTVLETLMVWQLLQVRHVHDVPLILVGKMWRGLVDWSAAAMLDPRLPLASPEDMKIPVCVDTADEAIAMVRDLHGRWSRPQGR